VTSLLTGVPVNPKFAMTGEITLRGTVMPVGGVKEKVLAALRAGIRETILPEKNKKDLEDIPDAVKEQMTFHWVSTMSQVLQLALGITKKPRKPQKRVGVQNHTQAQM
jgi:ATP-dependent Lon protease